MDVVSVKAIQRELQGLFKENLEGIKIDPKEDNIMILNATIEGPASTPYEKGLFKVRLVFTSNYPYTPPKCTFTLILGFFTTKIFHPNISSNGDVCVNVLQKEWKRELGIKHILIVWNLFNQGNKMSSDRA